jgi:transposase
MSYCAEKFKISNVLVKKIIKEFLIKENSKNDKIDVKKLSIDEKILFGKRNFYTIFRDYDTKKIIHIVKGTKSDVEKFSKFFGEKLKEIEAVNIDKSLSFISCVEKFLPKSKIVLDYFHIVKFKF